MANSHYTVAHNWANQTGRACKGFNMWYDGDTIYSYGRHFPIARIIADKCILFTTEDYSVSTAKHKSITWRACHDLRLPTFTVPFISDDIITLRGVTYNQDEIHAGNMESYAHRIKAAFEGSKRRRKPSYRQMDLQTCARLATEAEQYAECFEIENTVSVAIPDGLQSAIDAAQIEIAEYEVEQARKEAERNRQWIENDLPRWRECDPEIRAPYSTKRYLRINGDNVETSGYALVPLGDVRRAIPLVERMRDRGYITPMAKIKIGNFRLDGVSKHGIRVGCHFIDWAEIEYIKCKI